MKTYELPDGKNDYGYLDIDTGYDYKAGKVIASTMSRNREENGQPIPGCLVKVVYDLDTISQIQLTVEPGASSPTSGFVAHDGCEEISLVMAGKGKLELPGGESLELKTDISFYLKPGQPHRIVNDSKEVLKVMVFYSSTLANVPRTLAADDTAENLPDGFCVKDINEGVQNLAPGFTWDRPDDGHFTSIIFEGDNICFLFPIQMPNVSSPEIDFVSHPGVHELEFALSGGGTVIMPDKVYRLRPGIMRYNPPEQPSKSWNNTTEPLRLAVFYSTGRLANVSRTHKHARIFEILN